MALSASNVRVAVTGAVSVGDVSTTAPTGTAAALNAGFTDLGYVSEDGVTITLPGGGDSEAIKAWQNGATVRTIRSASEDLPSFSFTLLETKKEVIELYFGSAVTATDSEGSVEFDATDLRAKKSFVIDVVDGSELIRTYIPIGAVVEVGDQVYANAEAIGYEVTIEAERDGAKSYNFKQWSTATKTGA